MAEVVTLGCRINAFESQILKEKLASFDDVIVINTCAVTGEAERQCKQTIRKLKKENPDKKIIVTGCAAQVSPEKFSAMAEVDLVLGNKEKAEIEKYLHEFGDITSDIFSYDSYDKYLITGFEGRQKAFVQIQQGCNHRCTYCIVPYARGNNRSVETSAILKQIRELVAAGYQEICLTGVDICSYQPSLNNLIKTILSEVPELQHLAFGSLDPAEIDDEFIEIIQNERIVPYFHFSIQSGDDLILKRMGRRHNRDKVIKICTKIKQVCPSALLGADFICGFPTEEESNFINTLSLVAEAFLDQLHVFPYSIRQGTPAAKMPQVPVEIRKQRAKRLRVFGEKDVKVD